MGHSCPWRASHLVGKQGPRLVAFRVREVLVVGGDFLGQLSQGKAQTGKGQSCQRVSEKSRRS